MATGNEQHQIGKGQPIGQPRRQRMAFQMVDRIKRFSRCSRHRLAGHQADQQAADQARTASGGNRIDIGKRDTGAQKRFLDQRIQCLDMGTRRNLRHDTAIDAVLFQLAQHHVAENFAMAVLIPQHDGGCSLVAACFDTEDTQAGRHGLDYSNIAVTGKGGYTELR